jgi:hypothetical protein
VEGVLRVGEAFAALGDHAVVAQCARVAGQLAQGRDGAVRERVRDFAERAAAARARADGTP